MSRKAEKNSEERQTKRPCVGAPKQDDSPHNKGAMFDDLNTDVLVNILSYLVREQIDDVSVLSKHLAEARNHPSFDQSRTATIICKPRTVLGFYQSIARKAGSSFPHNGNKKILEVKGLENLEAPVEPGPIRRVYAHGQQTDNHLQSVTCLNLSASPKAKYQPLLEYNTVMSVIQILPNLQELDLSYNGMRYNDSLLNKLKDIKKICPDLNSIKWNGRRGSLPRMRKLAVLHLDDSQIFFNSEEMRMIEFGNMNHYLFYQITGLECLSIKNACYRTAEEPDKRHPFSQEMLIQLVRFHPTLRWLRSDLTEENIAMLKQQKPEVMIVSVSQQNVDYVS